MPSVWLVCPAYGRYVVTRLALAQRAHLRGELARQGIDMHCVVVADDANLDTAVEYGFHTVEQRNDQLGRKFNDGFQYAADHGADYMVSIGSDDWVHPDLFAQLPAQVVEPREPSPDEPVVVSPLTCEVVTGRNIVLVDLPGGRATVCRSKGLFGVIPWIFPRTALERSGFRPVPDGQQRGIDGALIHGLGLRPEWVFTDPHDWARVDFKSDLNLNSYAMISASIGTGQIDDPWAPLAEKYPQGLVKMARAAHELLAS